MVTGIEEGKFVNSADAKIWVLTDGKIGDDVQCLAIAKYLDPGFDQRIVAPRAPWAHFAPWGPVDPQEQPGLTTGPLAGEAPELAIFSGRRAIPHARALKKASDGQTRIVILKDPRLGRRYADVIWIPQHDRVTAPNVVSTLTSPHGLTPKIAKAQNNASPYASPFLGVVLGGPSGGARYTEKEAADLGARLSIAGRDYAAIAITPSRRTPQLFLNRLQSAVRHNRVHIWDGQGDNPYIDILAHAAALVVAADSHNMTSEALATNVGVYAWCPRGLAPKMQWFISELKKRGEIVPFAENADPFTRTPMDGTPLIVTEIQQRINF
ncbi:mitochondrial fission ELM1 family protein [Hyphococcus lacteus]|uniref:Mitochondrial fission ELM1 family protein n=1 Tax=Hyphococcus lacteus TaxID=3143536 RepID=A0ABV3Z870_9PROT